MSQEINPSFGSLTQIDTGVLNVGYAEAGPTDGPAVILLHGWPETWYAWRLLMPALTAFLASYREGGGGLR